MRKILFLQAVVTIYNVGTRKQDDQRKSAHNISQCFSEADKLTGKPEHAILEDITQDKGAFEHYLFTSDQPLE